MKMSKIKIWDSHIPALDEKTMQQVENMAALHIVSPHIAVMPDAHFGKGACVGTVIPTVKAVIPAAVGVDIGCGMLAKKTNLRAEHLPDNLHHLRCEIERAVPHGRTDNGGPNDRGIWSGSSKFITIGDYEHIDSLNYFFNFMYPKLAKNWQRCDKHLGTLGSGNHFIELCLDENDCVWIMLHTGSRGIGNAIGNEFIYRAKDYIERKGIILPDNDLAWLDEGTQFFNDYIFAVNWAQEFASINRRLILSQIIEVMEIYFRPRDFGNDSDPLGFQSKQFCGFFTLEDAINCHHNYVTKYENHYLTRKGAIDASKGTLGIIPGSMGHKSYIVRGLGNPDSFDSCSHGAGRVMSRGEAKRSITLDQHAADTAHVECRKDGDVLDESPRAYKNIDDVMESQKDLVEIVHTLRQVLCVKG